MNLGNFHTSFCNVHYELIYQFLSEDFSEVSFDVSAARSASDFSYFITALNAMLLLTLFQFSIHMAIFQKGHRGYEPLQET